MTPTIKLFRNFQIYNPGHNIWSFKMFCPIYQK